MQRINTTNKAVDLFGAGKHGFQSGNPSLNVRGTFGSAAFFNAVQEELTGVIEGAGLTLSGADNTQLRAAILSMIAAAASSVIVNSVTFEGTVANGHVVRWDAANNRFAKAIADGTANNRAAGIADVTNARVYAFGECPLFSGLTPGLRYFLDAGTLGFLNPAPAADPVMIGIAKTATTLFVDIDAGQNAPQPVHAAMPQTVLNGPMNASGTPNLGGATGGTSVTTANVGSVDPLCVSAAFGFDSATGRPRDYFGVSVSNLTWTGLNTNGAMYLFVEVNQGTGALTPVARTLAPIYQAHGAYSTVNGQFTYNWIDRVATIGNGSVATPLTAVCVGEVTVAAGVVTAITWYAYQGRAESDWIANLPGVSASLSWDHNIGTQPRDADLIVECTIAEQDMLVGEQVSGPALMTQDAGGTYYQVLLQRTAKALRTRTGSGSSIEWRNPTTGATFNATTANYRYKWTAARGW